MKNLKILFRYVFIIFTCHILISCGGSGTTIVGNTSPSAGSMEVNESQITYSRMSDSTVNVSAERSAFLFGENISAQDLSISILVDGVYFSTLSSNDFSNTTSSASSRIIANNDINMAFQTTSSFFSTNVTAQRNSIITLIINIGPTQQSIVVSGVVPTGSTNPTRVNTSAGLTSSENTVNTNGFASLRTLNFAQAQDDYCSAIENGSLNSTISFGCFLTNLLSVAETAETTNLMNSFDEGVIDVRSVILEGIFPNISSGAENFRYTNFPALPLNDVFTASYSSYEKMEDLLERLATSGNTAEEIRAQFFALKDDFEAMESLLKLSQANGNFSFTIPAELFSSETDLTVSQNDLNLFLAGIQNFIFMIDLSQAYNPGVNPEHVVIEDQGSGGDAYIDKRILVADLNGVAGTVTSGLGSETIPDNAVTVDSISFLTLDNGDLIRSAKTRFIQSMRNSFVGLSAIQNGEASEVFSKSLDEVNLQDAITLSQELFNSTSNSGMVQLSIVTGRTVSVNLSAFFSSPPSSQNVSSDPFVYDEDFDDVQFVESFFRDFLNGIVEF